MNAHLSRLTLATLALAATLGLAGPAAAQVAGGTTTTDVSIVESTRMAMGWSVKKSLMGKTIYNDANQKVGKVDDLIISPDRSVSYVIVGAGGFIGLGRHDVAIPVTQIEERQGKLVMPGATKDTLKAMPAFQYVSDTAGRDRLMAAAEKDIAAGKAKVVELENKTGVAAAEAKARIDQQNTAVKADVKAAEAKLGEMKKATAARWKEFEASVSEATARLRKSIDAATG
jgi:sporulation protein YlmC with PRC-barrel domain